MTKLLLFSLAWASLIVGFHIEGIPRVSFNDREGKQVAQSIDMRTRKQFLEILEKAGLR